MRDNDQLLVFFSALSDANRLKIVGLLAQKDYSVEELAEILGLRASTVSHHLSKLSKVGLVSAQAESYYNVYHLNAGMLQEMSKSIFDAEALPGLAAGVDLDAYDRKVVADFTLDDGRLKNLPAQRKKLDAVLRYVVQVFEEGQRFSEREVNEKLARFFRDTASLRREMIGAKLLERDSAGKDYKRVK